MMMLDAWKLVLGSPVSLAETQMLWNCPLKSQRFHDAVYGSLGQNTTRPFIEDIKLSDDLSLTDVCRLL